MSRKPYKASLTPLEEPLDSPRAALVEAVEVAEKVAEKVAEEEAVVAVGVEADGTNKTTSLFL